VGEPGKENSLDDFQHLDDYALLGVSPGAAPESIKQAYRREIAKYHPDRFRNADPAMQQYARERSQRITEAYASLNRNPRARSQPRRAQPASSAEQLAADYQQAQTLLATGAAAEAARLLRQIQRVDPFYRDVDSLLSQAEALSSAGAASRRRPAALLAGGLLGLLLLGGGVYGWSALQSPDLAQQPGATPAVIAGQNPSSVAAPTATATPAVVADVPTAPVAGGALPTAEAAPTNSPPPTEVPPSPTSLPPTAEPTVEPTAAPPPPTEVPPPPTEIPPTPAPPTRVPRPTARPTARPAPTQPPRQIAGVESGQVLVADAFGDPGSGWPILQEPNYTLGYRDGAYVITSQPNTGAVFAYGSPLGQNNAIIGADVTPVRGAAGLNFGPNNSYRFVISADGRFRVEQRGRVIVRPTASNAIRAGRNRLVLAVVGTRASVYANGVLLANLNVSAPLAGTTYGFVVIPGPNGGEAIFDSLTVRTLPR
jgi:hypothetical protein